jgi:ribosomal protein S18 acetylase RimI-like enzyme
MEKADIAIRRLGEADAARFRAIRLDALTHHPHDFGASVADEAAAELDAFADMLRRNAIFGAMRGHGEKEGQLLGVVAFYPQAGEKLCHKGVLWGVYVRHEARRLGLGRRLIEAALAHAASLVELVQLTVPVSNEPARALYRGQGFVDYGLEQRALKFADRYVDEALMVKFLKPLEGNAQ